MKNPLWLLALSALPCAAAINPAIVPAESRWVIYADFDALRSSTLGRQIVTMAETAQLGNAPVGINVQKVLTTVGNVTAYGTNFAADPKLLDGTLVARGTPELRKIAESLILQGQIANPDVVSEITDLGFTAYLLKAKTHGKIDEAGGVIVAFPPEPIVLVSKSRSQLLKARDAFLGKAPTLAKSSDAPLRNLLHNAHDTYLFAASVVPPETALPENQPQTRILKMTNAGAIGFGEQGPNTFGHAELIATSDQMADKLMKILQGMTAMMSLAETNDKALADFLNSAAVARHDNTVTLDLSYSSERLAQMIKTMDQQHHAVATESGPRNTGNDLINGDVLGKWQAVPAAVAGDGSPAPLAWHTIENVALKNGTVISLGRANNGGKSVRFDRVEITSSAGGAPLVFRLDYMRQGGPRNNLSVFQFPGADGTYTLRVAYVNDPEGKATYAVSARAPRTPPPERRPDHNEKS